MVKKAEPSRWHAMVGSRGAPNMAPTNKVRQVAANGDGVVGAVNRFFRRDGSETAPLPRKAETLEDVTRGIGLERGVAEQVQAIVGQANPTFDQKSQTQRIFLAQSMLIEVLRALPDISSDQRGELVKRARAYWQFHYQTDYGKKPTVRARYSKSEPELVIKARGSSKGPTKYKRRWRGPNGQWQYDYGDELGEKSKAILRKLASRKPLTVFDPAALNASQRSGLTQLVRLGLATVDQGNVTLTAAGQKRAAGLAQTPTQKRGKGKQTKVTRHEAVAAFSKTPLGQKTRKVDRYGVVKRIIEEAQFHLESGNGQTAREKLTMLGLDRTLESRLLVQLDKRVAAKLKKAAVALNGDEKRVTLPQIPAAKLQEFLHTVEGDAKRKKLDPKKLQPTQDKLESAKVARLQKDAEALKKPIIVSQDHWIIDGHHRWAACKALGRKVPCVVIGLDKEALLEQARNFKGAEFRKAAGPYIGKRGGKWADAAHTIPWGGHKGVQQAGGKKSAKPRYYPGMEPRTHEQSVAWLRETVEAVEADPKRGSHPRFAIHFGGKGLSVKQARALLDKIDKHEPTHMAKGGPYIGKRGGKWADPQHTIPWKESAPAVVRKRKAPRDSLKTSLRAMELFRTGKTRKEVLAFVESQGHVGVEARRLVQHALRHSTQDAIEEQGKRSVMPPPFAGRTMADDAYDRAMGRPIQKADKIPGGLASGKNSRDFDKKKLEAGTKVELEHTSDRAIAREIAMDHLTEDPNYYEKLATIEKSEPVLIVKAEQLGLNFAGTGSAGPKAPPGYSAVPNSQHGGYRKKVGGKYRYWYPEGSKPKPRKKRKKKGPKRADVWGNLTVEAVNQWRSDANMLAKAHKALSDRATEESDLHPGHEAGPSPAFKRDFRKLEDAMAVFSTQLANWGEKHVAGTSKAMTVMQRIKASFEDIPGTGTMFTYGFHQDSEPADDPEPSIASMAYPGSFGEYRRNDWKKSVKKALDEVEVYVREASYSNERLRPTETLVRGKVQFVIYAGGYIPKDGEGTSTRLDGDVRDTLRHAEEMQKTLDRIGLGKATEGLTVHVHGESRREAEGTEKPGFVSAGYYSIVEDYVRMFPCPRTLHTLIHEVGHRVYFQQMSPEGRESWERFYESRKTHVTARDVELFIDILSRYPVPNEDTERLGLTRGMIDFAQAQEAVNRIAAEDPKLGPRLQLLSEQMSTAMLHVPGKKSQLTAEDWRKGYTLAYRKGLKDAGRSWPPSSGEGKPGLKLQATEEHVSDYAETNARELFAEAFDAYVRDGRAALEPRIRDQIERALASTGMPLKKSEDEPTLVAPLRKGSKPPAGYAAVPRSERGGYRKRVGGKWRYWYPDAKHRPAKPEPDEFGYKGPAQPGHDLYQTEAAIQGEPVEHCAAFDGSGQAIWRQKGQKRAIHFSPEAMDRFRAAADPVFTHNHPSGNSLSPEDLSLAAQVDLAEMRAVGPAGVVYRCKRPEQGWPRAEMLLKAMRKAWRYGADHASREMDATLREIDPAHPFDHTHPGYSNETWTKICAKAITQEYNEAGARFGIQIEKLDPARREERLTVRRELPARRSRPGVSAQSQKQATQLGFDFGKGLRFVVPLQKAQGAHKYIKRVPYMKDGKRKYRYYYRESAAARDVQEGETVRLGKKLIEILGIGEDGTVTMREGDKTRQVSADEWTTLMTRQYGQRYLDWSEKRAAQTVNAVLKSVPKELLQDLKGSDAERLKQLEKRVPEVYAKLKKSFARSGVSPFRAKAVLGMVLERRGWEPEARAAVIGTVIEQRNSPYRQMVIGAENLAAGKKVTAGHVAAVSEVLSPQSGKSPKDELTELASRAERELAALSAALAKAKGAGSVEALKLALNSPAMAQLMMTAQAMPGFKDKAIDPVRQALNAAQASLPRKKPTRDGAESVVYVSGEGGAPRALKARYKLVEAGEAVASHKPGTFSKRTDYPEGVQERAYHRDKDEQAKVLRNAQKLNPAFLINTNPDAVNGPPIVDQNGVVLGGNSRTMSMQLAYEQHPDKADAMKAYLAEHAHEVGFSKEDIGAMKNPILVREVQSEGTADQKLLVRQMNESFTQAMDPRTMQVALGRKLDEGALKELGDSMQADETLGAFLDSKRAEGFINALTRTGIIDQRNSNQYMVKNTKRLNEDGKQLVERVLVGRTVGDADLLSNTGSKLIGNIARSVPFLAQAKAHGATYDLGGDLKVALEAFNDLHYRAQQGHRAALSSTMSDTEFKGLFAQDEMFGEQNPIVKNERAMTLLEVLIRKNGPQKMAAVFRDYAAKAAQHPEDQDNMFGDKPKPEALLAQAMKAEKTEKSMEPTLMVKSGLYIGKRGGKWADPQHTIPWKEPRAKKAIEKHLKNAERIRAKAKQKEARKEYNNAAYDYVTVREQYRAAQKLGAPGLAGKIEQLDDKLYELNELDYQAGAEYRAAHGIPRGIRPEGKVKKARGNTFMTHVPVAPQAGSAPRFHTPPIPDFQEIYCQPDDTAKQRKEREQGETRRRAEAERNRGKYGMHGSPIGLKPVLRWGETDMGASSVAIHEPERVTKRTPRKSPKLVARQQVESAAKPNEDKLDKKKSKRKKKKKKTKLVARVK